MKRAVIVSHPSLSSRLLRRRLGIRRVVVGRDTRIPTRRLVINWGCTELPELAPNTKILNAPGNVSAAVDKMATFQVLKQAGIPTVAFTDSEEEAFRWLKSGKTVYGRKLTKASEGRGIVLWIAGKSQVDKLPNLPLFTKFWKCDKEFRVHVFGDSVIDFSEKRRLRVENPAPDRYWIRTHDRGWIFARTDAQLNEKVKETCVRAVKALGLDFGAVDVRVRDSGEHRILEVNSAPGITGQTLDKYEQSFRSYISGL